MAHNDRFWDSHIMELFPDQYAKAHVFPCVKRQQDKWNNEPKEIPEGQQNTLCDRQVWYQKVWASDMSYSVLWRCSRWYEYSDDVPHLGQRFWEGLEERDERFEEKMEIFKLRFRMAVSIVVLGGFYELFF